MHGIKITAFVGIALLLIAANLDSPSPWLLLVGWETLVFAIGFKVASVPRDSSFIGGFAPCCLLLLFQCRSFETSLTNLLTFVAKPSAQHLIHFGTGRPFLFLVIVYLAAVSLLLILKLEDARRRLEKGAKDHQETSKIVGGELQRVDREANERRATAGEAVSIIPTTPETLQ